MNTNNDNYLKTKGGELLGRILRAAYDGFKNTLIDEAENAAYEKGRQAVYKTMNIFLIKRISRR